MDRVLRSSVVNVVDWSSSFSSPFLARRLHAVLAFLLIVAAGQSHAQSKTRAASDKYHNAILIAQLNSHITHTHTHRAHSQCQTCGRLSADAIAVAADRCAAIRHVGHVQRDHHRRQHGAVALSRPSSQQSDRKCVCVCACVCMSAWCPTVTNKVVNERCATKSGLNFSIPPPAAGRRQYNPQKGRLGAASRYPSADCQPDYVHIGRALRLPARRRQRHLVATGKRRRVRVKEMQLLC